MSTTRIVRLGTLPLLLGLSLLPGRAAPPPTGPDDPDEQEQEQAERRDEARLLVRLNCLICHSEEMVARQRLTPAQWKTEVEKMVGWGTPLTKAQEPAVAEFLSGEYGEATPQEPPRRISYDEALATVAPDLEFDTPSQGDPTRGAALYAANCATCHGPDARGGDLGPNLVEAAVLLRRADYANVVLKGRNRMPGYQALLGPERGEDILAWLRRQRYDPARR